MENEINRIRVRSKDAYIIEVNDAGETIEFDLTDIDLPLRLERSMQTARETGEWLNQRLLVIRRREDHTSKGSLLSDNERAAREAYREAYGRLRDAIDAFCGEGASAKIFGQKNYLEMFSDLMEQLEPHLEKMRAKGMDIRTRIAAKYGADEDEKAADEAL